MSPTAYPSAKECRRCRKILNLHKPTSERRILRRPEVERKTGFKRAHIYGLMKVGKFPKCMRLG